MMKIQALSIIIALHLITSSNSGVPRDRNAQSHHSQRNGQNEALGLYDSNDKVISLSNDTFNSMIIHKNYATLLEFYNSFCGHCKRFAPDYKKLSSEIYSWRDVVKVMAIDCANDANNDICRQYEVMAYPSLRYFSPNYEESDKQFGQRINDQIIEAIKSYLIKFVMNETNVDSKWPDFSNLTEIGKDKLFKGIPNDVLYIFVIYESEDSLLGGEMILHYSKIPSIRIRRTTIGEVAASFNIKTHNQIAIIDRNLNNEISSVANPNFKTFRNVVDSFLESKNIQQTIETNSDEIINGKNPNLTEIENPNQKIINEIKKKPQTVYQADLENALRYTIFHEIPKFSVISGDRLLALQRYVSILNRYNPLDDNGHKFVEDLRAFIMMHNQEIHGENIQEKLAQLEREYSPISKGGKVGPMMEWGWVGCLSSKPNFRGFTCGLWQLFHFITVQAAQDEKSADYLESLQAIYGYVKHFFGCSECSIHFQKMAAKNKIWSTSSKENAILWLWSAHNEVNERLAGDETEDPSFPKIQFPTKDMCPKCIRSVGSSSSILGINWDKSEVLEFMKRIYHPQNISHYGIDDESVLPETKIRVKRLIGSVFSDIDVRMGILLYIFCIGMMIVAVKLFLRKGYRKKTYGHDFIGKF